MAHLACPCGNSPWNGCDGDETEYYFVEGEVLKAHPDDFAFFEVQFSDLSTEIWKCDICDRMMIFDDPCGSVSRYMRRIDAESLGDSELARDHKSGICFSESAPFALTSRFSFRMMRATEDRRSYAARYRRR